MNYFLNGILYGLVLMFSAGPTFFFLIKVGIERGFKKGMSFAFGTFLSDVLLLGLIYIGLKPLFDNQLFRQIFSLTSGIAIAFFGIKTLLKKNIEKEALQIEIKKENHLGYIAKGFAVNLFNPFTIALWVGILGTVSPSEPTDFSFFIAGLLGIIFLGDLSKAFLAKVIGKAMTPLALFRLNRILGIAFTVIGIYFIYLFVNSVFLGEEIEINIPEI